VGRVREPTELCVRSWDELGVEQALDKKFFVRVSECEPSARESDKSKDFNATESLWHKNAATLEFPDLNYLAKNTFCLMTTCAVMNESFVWLDRGGSRGGDAPPPKTYESNYIHRDFLQFENQHSQYKANLSSIVLLQQYCEGHFIPLTVVKPL